MRRLALVACLAITSLSCGNVRQPHQVFTDNLEERLHKLLDPLIGLHAYDAIKAINQFYVLMQAANEARYALAYEMEQRQVLLLLDNEALVVQSYQIGTEAYNQLTEEDKKAFEQYLNSAIINK